MPHERHAIDRRRSQPIGIQPSGQDHHHAPLILSPMKIAHQLVIPRIDRQHRVTEHLLTCWIGPALPQPSNSHRFAIKTRNPRSNGFTRSPIRLINRLRRDNAVLRTTPGITKGRLLPGCFRTSVIGSARNFGVFAPTGGSTQRTPTVALLGEWPRPGHPS